ncbi:alpha/beta hydrolase [Paenibacillus oralis]|uniref:Alpha/beta hydrolase n=1 Tax=Paenibacillus oralis TaxID=2490856 RepID=A0A3P3TY18_9BACL|nr:alpha/beta hydrolase [Paenibacillus oralis]RRJ62730.1 alpha/beta hydrolase [Paenibacillus oralis]
MIRKKKNVILSVSILLLTFLLSASSVTVYADTSTLSKEQEQLIKMLRSDEDKVSEELMNKYKVGKTEEMMVPTRDGETHIYVYYPDSDQKGPYPLFVNIHGGGFITGYREQDIVFSKNISSRANYVVIDIDYTPAPEKKYPYALHQSYDVIKWASKNSELLNIDPEKIVLCGHSAGGNLAAAVTLLNNVRHDFKIALQILDYPSLNLYTPQPLKRNAYKDPVNVPLSIASLYNSAFVDEEKDLDPTAYARLSQLYYDAYIDEDYRLDPTASPIFAPDEMLIGLPEALIITCWDDYRGEDAEKYAYRLLQAGVPVTARRMTDSSHGFVVSRDDQFEEAEKMIFDALDRVYKK